MIRKQGKLPDNNLKTIEYNYEYSSGVLQMQAGEGEVILVDDVIATGGTMEAANELATSAGYSVIEQVALIDVGITEHDIKTIMQYENKA
jgi:adenine phosphoribosyltransferase